MKWNFSPLCYSRKLRSMLYWFIIFEFKLWSGTQNNFSIPPKLANSSQNVQHSARGQNMQISTVDVLKLHWKPLDRRRTEHRAIFMFKVVNNLFMHTFHCSFNSNYHNYNTRSKRNIRKSSAHRRWGHWITSNFAADAWNALPLSLRDVPTLSQFKRGIKKAIF